MLEGLTPYEMHGVNPRFLLQGCQGDAIIPPVFTVNLFERCHVAYRGGGKTEAPKGLIEGREKILIVSEIISSD